jgi:hypothetical protein
LRLVSSIVLVAEGVFPVFTAQRTALEEIRLIDSVMKKHVVSANRTWWSKWRLFYQTPMLGTKQTPGGLVADGCFGLENA